MTLKHITKVKYIIECRDKMTTLTKIVRVRRTGSQIDEQSARIIRINHII